MYRKIYILFISLFVFAAAQADNSIKRLVFSNPIIPTSVPDPCIIKAGDGYFYLYGTEDHHNVPIYRSRNLVDWLFIGTAFTNATRPRTVSPYVKYTYSDGSTKSPMIWAPDIAHIGDKYVLYYAIGVWGDLQKSGIGVAWADSPEGPFIDGGALFLSEDIGVSNSIDAQYVSDGGKNYLVWGSFKGIYIIQLTDDGLHLMPGAAKQQIAGTLTEGSYIYKRGGYYYLFGSAGSCCSGANSTYHVVVGRATSLLGPYLDKSGYKMLNNKAELVVSGDDFVAGPGHNAEIVEDDKGQTWMPMHGYPKADAGKGRCVYLVQIKWKDNWPYVEGGVLPQTAEAPYFKNSK